ncbi:MAG TPA: periplasmic heavy metal sensor [Casimicrobiaceae bacterium]|nr:periplasmic heavy metal sensor [Casimicrobiaceae bacterium]
MPARTLRGVAIAAGLAAALIATAPYAQGHGHRAHHGMHGGGQIEHAIAQVKEQLALTSAQQILWDNAVAATKAARQAGRAELGRTRAVLKAEIAKPEPDLAALAAVADEAQAAHQAVRRQVRDEWLKLYATFSPAQKAVVRDQLANRLERFERFRERMHERFSGRQG